MEKCLYCYKPLKPGQIDYHPTCAKKLYGTKEAPVLPYVRKEIGDLAKKVVRAQTTLTGVQAKLSLDVNPGGKNEPSRFTIVGLWGKYILKPQTDRYRCLPEIEDLTMHLAEAAKITVVPHGLIRFADGELCYITRRIDRLDDGTKVPMEDMCQLSERLTEYKYKGSYEQIAKLLKKYSSFSQLDLVNYQKKRNEHLFQVIHYALIIIYKTLFSEIILFLVQFSLLSHHLFLLLALQLLESLHSCHEAACLLRITLVLLIALFQDGEKFLVVGGLTQSPHDGSTEEQ
jgi:hypothetical protein